MQTRLSGNAFWEILVFLVNALLFAIVGLQLRGILDRLNVTGSLLADAAYVTAAVIVLRIVWVPIFTYVPRLLFRSVREHDPYPPWQAPAVIAWAGNPRRCLARGGARAAGVAGEPRPDRLSDVRSHPGHARRAGPDARRG